MDDAAGRTSTDAAPLIPWDRLANLVVSRGWIVAMGIVLLGFGLRVSSLNEYWLNPDEGLNYSIATWQRFGDFWSEVQANAHPPLYYLLLWLMDSVATDITWYRMLSLVPGCLAIFGTYLLGKEVGGAWVGLITAFLVSISPSAIELSQIMRPYMFLVASLSFALYFLARYLRTSRPRDLWVYSAFMVVALLTHYSSLIVMGAVGIVLLGLLLARKIPRTELKRLVVAHLPLGLTMVAVSFHLRALLNSDLQVQAQGYLSRLMITDVASVWLNFIGVMRYLFGLGYSGPTILLLLAGLFLAVKRGNLAAFGIPVAVLGLAVLAAALEQYPFGISRHAAYLLPILAVPVAAPIAAGLTMGRKAAVATVVAVLALILLRQPVSAAMGAGSNPQRATEERILPQEDVASLEQKLREVRASGRPILMAFQTYYALIPLWDGVRDQREWKVGQFFHFPWGQSQIIVNGTWKMTTKTDPADPRESFYGFLQRIDAAMPELDIMNESSSTVLVAGWETGFVVELMSFEPGAEMAVVSDGRRLYLGVLRVNLKKFVDAMKD